MVGFYNYIDFFFCIEVNTEEYSIPIMQSSEILAKTHFIKLKDCLNYLNYLYELLGRRLAAL